MLFLSFACVQINAQFSGAAGTTGSEAIFKDSSVFKGWASKCSIQRGWMNIANQSLGKTSVGDSTSALGRPGQNGIVSLGDGGQAVVQFAQSIKNGPGPDFAIFENSFSDKFLELAFVEVSSDSQTWVRFPATCNHSQDTQIGPFDEKSDPTKLNNLAGKHRAQYGTPFDLGELKDSAGINVDSIVYIRLVDCVGSLNAAYATYDAQGNKINDPFATPFASSGFDLDAIGVMHQNILAANSVLQTAAFVVYPNPMKQGEHLKIVGIDEGTRITILSAEGRRVHQVTQSDFANLRLSLGMYFLSIHGKTIKLQVVD